MSIWIITTGNSDVQLNTDDNWEDFYEEIRYDLKCDKFVAIDQDKTSQLFPVSARVLGMVYQNHLQNNFDDLAFPLLDTFSQYFYDNLENTPLPSIVIILLTDQENIFIDEEKNLNEEVENQSSPFWQDTCTLELIFKEYFKRSDIFSDSPPLIIFKTLKPKSVGLDNWNETFTLITDTLEDVKQDLSQNLNNNYPQYDPNEIIYVSHQAGTPAISSAVQFVSLSKFKYVEFLCSNIYYDSYDQQSSHPEIVKISKYWLGIQIQKAKQLIIDGLPGVALTLLDEIGYVDNKNLKPRLQHMVRIFNIRESLNKGDEFKVDNAIQRVVDALDLIEIYFKDKNYLQGITLLAAAHETFLKAAIVNAISKKTINLNVNGMAKSFQSQQLVQWQQQGLLFIRNAGDTYFDKTFKSVLGIPDSDTDKQKIINIKTDILTKLSFPVDDFRDRFNSSKSFDLINSNSALFKWLCKLKPKQYFQPWDLLQWICIGKDSKKEHEDDIRNQLMHNLLGVNEKEVIQYLQGNSNSPNTDVLVTYQQAVKDKFLHQIKHLGLNYKDRNLYDELQAIANDIS